MEKRECFGLIEEMTDGKGLTTLKARPGCRDCGDFRDCIRQSKQVMEEKREKNELRKQNLIAQIIDISHMISNEVGSCLLDFLTLAGAYRFLYRLHPMFIVPSRMVEWFVPLIIFEVRLYLIIIRICV